MLTATVSEAARRFGDRPAFVAADGRPTSYRELDRRSDAAAATLAESGIGPGQVVALTLDSGVEWVVAAAAVAKVGAATAGINPRLTDAERSGCLAVAEPALDVGHGDEVIALERAGADRSAPNVGADPDRAAAIVFTSGTTGAPRGAWFAERHLAAVTRLDVGDAWGDPDAPAVPMLAATQMAHVGFTTKVAWYLRLGTTTHLLDRWRAADVLEVVERTHMPTLGGVAPQVALLLCDPTLDRRDLSGLTTLVVGGGPSSPALVADARRRLAPGYSIRYSSTESGGCGTATSPDADHHSVGRPRPGIEMSLRTDEGVPVDDGAVGEVWLRSGAVMAGYWHDRDATAVALTPDGWLRTGDLGRIDESGCLVLAGRRSEMFIRGGYNVHPQEVEAVLADHPAVAQVAVVAQPSDVMGEIGVAVVVADPNEPPVSLEALRDHARARLAGHKLPEALQIVEALPLTAMQKVDRRRLAIEVAPGSTAGPGSVDRTGP